MELFLPSLLLVLLAGIVIFGIFPSMPRFFLVVLAIGLIAATGYHHHVIFQDEYTQSTWQDSVISASTPFLVTILVIFMIGYLLNFVRSGGAKASPPAAAATAPAMNRNFTTTQRQALESLIRNP